MHAIFYCDFARAAWLASPMGLRTDRLQGNFKEVILELKNSLQHADFCKLICMAWAVWRARNDAIHGEKKQSFRTCKEYYTREVEACTTLGLCAKWILTRQQKMARLQENHRPQMINDEEYAYTCYVDGSWAQNGNAGIGLYLMKEGVLVQWVSKPVQALSPSQAEAIAILEGLKLLKNHAGGKGLVLSDSKENVHALSFDFPNIQDWRSYSEVWEAWQIQAEMKGVLRSIYCSRQEEGIKKAHLLANQRVNSRDMNGSNFSDFVMEQLM